MRKEKLEFKSSIWDSDKPGGLTWEIPQSFDKNVILRIVYDLKDLLCSDFETFPMRLVYTKTGFMSLIYYHFGFTVLELIRTCY